MQRLRNQQTGFTLLELLLYIAIVSSLLLVLSTFFVSSASTKASNQVENDINQQASFIMDTITQTIRNADSITTPSANNTAVQLTLAVPTASSSPAIFSLSNGVLTLKEGTATAIALTSNDIVVSNFSVKNSSKTNTPGSLQISFTLSTQASTRNEFTYQRTFTTSASLRH